METEPLPAAVPQKRTGGLNVRLLLGLGLSILFAWLAIRGVNFEEAFATAARAHLGWIAASVLFLALGILAKVERWQLLFHPRRGLSRVNLLSAMLIGYLVNTILPARIGEVSRAYLASRSNKVATAHALSTIFVERILDSLTLVLMLVLVLPILPVSEIVRRSVLTFGLLILVVFLVMVALTRREDNGLAIFSPFLKLAPERFRPWLADQLESALSSLEALKDLRVHSLAWGWSLVIWGLEGASTYAVMAAFELPVPAATAFLLASVLNLGMVIPSSPGYLGVYHFLAVQTLGSLGVGASLALSYSVILHLTNFGLISLAALPFVLREGVSLGELSRPGASAS